MKRMSCTDDVAIDVRRVALSIEGCQYL